MAKTKTRISPWAENRIEEIRKVIEQRKIGILATRRKSEGWRTLRSRDTWIKALTKFPNPNSKFQTVTSLHYDCHYTRLRLTERWTWERYAKLAYFLRMTPCELASFVLLPHSMVLNYQRTGRLPRSCARPIALILTLIEAYLMGRYAPKDVITDPFPKAPDGLPQNP